VCRCSRHSASVPMLIGVWICGGDGGACMTARYRQPPVSILCESHTVLRGEQHCMWQSPLSGGRQSGFSDFASPDHSKSGQNRARAGGSAPMACDEVAMVPASMRLPSAMASILSANNHTGCLEMRNTLADMAEFSLAAWPNCCCCEGGGAVAPPLPITSRLQDICRSEPESDECGFPPRPRVSP
jgi:hypothetical protein